MSGRGELFLQRFCGGGFIPYILVGHLIRGLKEVPECFRTRDFGVLLSGRCPKENLEVSYLFVVLRCCLFFGGFGAHRRLYG